MSIPEVNTACPPLLQRSPAPTETPPAIAHNEASEEDLAMVIKFLETALPVIRQARERPGAAVFREISKQLFDVLYKKREEPGVGYTDPLIREYQDRVKGARGGGAADVDLIDGSRQPDFSIYEIPQDLTTLDSTVHFPTLVDKDGLFVQGSESGTEEFPHHGAYLAVGEGSEILKITTKMRSRRAVIGPDATDVDVPILTKDVFQNPAQGDKKVVMKIPMQQLQCLILDAIVIQKSPKLSAHELLQTALRMAKSNRPGTDETDESNDEDEGPSKHTRVAPEA
ncbi:hypothetical protein OBBRIDRAFT_838209 [Obba rivulosa]|uniref:Uncharacterized protein n=1 Tax=Obba rivulosa TaxID=1052685 RepID=A0A8E2DI03_9APHY|nr:hypothetical protein OBBRIDRAFT_838209 [Obba rivulosa]